MEKLRIVQKTQNSSHTNERITDTTQNPNKHFKGHVDTLILINTQFEKTSVHFNKENSQIILRCHSQTKQNSQPQTNNQKIIGLSPISTFHMLYTFRSIIYMRLNKTLEKNRLIS